MTYDKTFCSKSAECKLDCDRRLDDETRKVMEEIHHPIYISNFDETDECKERK